MDKDCIVKYKGKGYTLSELRLHLKENANDDEFIEIAKELNVEYNPIEDVNGNDGFTIGGSMESFTQSNTPTQTDKEKSLSVVKGAKNIEKVNNVYDTIKSTQETTVKPGQNSDFYTVKGENYERVSGVKATVFEGDSGKYENARIAGNTVDSLTRDLVNDENPQFEDYKSKFKDEETFNKLKKEIEDNLSMIKKKGFVPVIVKTGNDNNIKLKSDRLKIAGEIDLLFVNEEGKFLIIDVKSSDVAYDHPDKVHRYTNKLENPYYDNDGNKVRHVERSKQSEHQLQLSMYANLLKEMTGLTDKDIYLAVMPLNVIYDRSVGTGVINEVIKESEAITPFSKHKDVEYYIPMTGQRNLIENNDNDSINVKKHEVVESVFPISDKFVGLIVDLYKTESSQNDNYNNYKNEINANVVTQEVRKNITELAIQEGITGEEYLKKHKPKEFNDLDNGAYQAIIDAYTERIVIKIDKVNLDDLDRTPGGEAKTKQEVLQKDPEQVEAEVTVVGEEKSNERPSRRKTGGSGTKKLFSSVNSDNLEDYQGRDLSEEVEWLKEVLPYVPNKVSNTFFDTGDGYAEGIFYKGVIGLSRMSKVGVAYHEGFHAVTQMYLNQQARNELYKEYRKEMKDNSLTNLQAEEGLAEEFREYMINRKKVDEGSLMGRLFQLLKDLVNFFRNNKKSKVFRRIRKGKYNYKPVNKTDEILFSKSKMKSNIYNDAINLTTYAMIKNSGLNSMDKDASLESKEFGKLKETVFNQIEQIYDEKYDLFEEAEANGDEDKASYYAEKIKNIEDLLDDYNLVWESAKARITAMNLSEAKKEDDDVSEDERSSKEIKAKPHLNYSGKDNATGNTKLMVSLLVDKTGVNESFGTPKMIDMSKTWVNVENLLIGSKSVDEMIKRLRKDKGRHPEFEELADRVENAPLYKKVQFYVAFAKQSIHYIGSYSNENEDGTYKVKIGNADQATIANDMLTTMNSNLMLDFHDSYGNRVANVSELVEKKIAKYKALTKFINDAHNLYSKTLKETNSEEEAYAQVKLQIEEVKKRTLDLLNEIGLQYTQEDLNYYTSNYSTPNSFGEETLTRYDNLLSKIDAVVLGYKSDDVKKGSLVGFLNNHNKNKEKSDYSIEYEDLWLSKNSIIRELTKARAERSPLEGKNMVKGAGNNDNWTKSEGTMMSLVVDDLKSGDTSNYDNKIYHKHSDLIRKIKSSKKFREDFGMSVFLVDKKENSRDTGTDYSDTQEADDIILRMNLAFNNFLSPMTFGDKSTWYLFRGLNYKSYGYVKRDAEGKLVTTGKPTQDFYRYIIAEKERINLVASGKSVKEKTLKKKGGKFQFFPSLNKIDGIFNEDGSVNDDVLTDELMDAAIDYAMKDNMTKMKKELIKNKLIHTDADGNLAKNSEGKYVDRAGNVIRGSLIKGISNEYYKSITDDLVGKTDEEKQLIAFTQMVGDYVFSSVYANIEFTMVFTGDVAFYQDLSKRIQSVSAQGTQNAELSEVEDENFRVPKTYNIAIGSDKEIENSLFKEYVEDFKRLGEVDFGTLEAYKENNQTDGIAYITPKRFRDLMLMQGQWYPEHEKAYRSYLDTGNVDVSLLKPMQSLKGVHFELVSVGDQLVPVYLKYSQMVLWPGLTMGTKLQNLHDKMVEDGVDEYVTGIKVGIFNESKVGEVIDGTHVGPLKTLALKNSNWRLQQDLRPKYAKGINSIVSSQAKKTITTNTKGKNIVDLGTGEMKKGEDIAAQIHAIEGSVSLEKMIELEESTGMNDLNSDRFTESIKKGLMIQKASLNTIEAVGEVQLDTIFQIRNTLQTQIMSKINKAGVRYKATGGSFIQMPGVGIQAINQEGLLGLTKGKNQALFFEEIEELRGPRFKRDSEGNYVYHKDKDGNETNKKVVEEGEVMIPFSYLEMIPGWENMSTEDIKGKLSDVLKSVIGLRIPNQGLSSIDAMNVVGILPKSMGDSIVVYTGMTSKTGSDFDIDKLFMLMPNARYNEKTGNVEREEYIQGEDDDSIKRRYDIKVDNFIKKNLNRIFKQELKDIKSEGHYQGYVNNILSIIEGRLKSASKTTNYEAIDGLTQRKAQLEKELDPESKEFNKSYFEDNPIEVNQEYLVENDLFLSLEEFAMQSVEDQNTLNAKENRRIELWRSVLLAEDMFVDAVSSIDSTDLKDDAYYINFTEDYYRGDVDLRLVEEVVKGLKDEKGDSLNLNLADLKEFLAYDYAYKKLSDFPINKFISEYNKANGLSDLELASPTHQIKIKAQNMGSKIGIGQGANHLSHHALAQMSNLSIKFKVGKIQSKLDLSREFDFRGKRISQTISGYLNAYLDNAKDPYITLINNNKATANVVFLLLRSGLPKDVVNRFISQPILKELSNNKSVLNAKIHRDNPVFAEFNKVTVSEDTETGLNEMKEAKKNQVVDAVAETWAKYNGGDYNMSVLPNIESHLFTNTEGLSKDELNDQMDEIAGKLEEQLKNPNDNTQKEILLLYLSLSERSSRLSDLVRASKYDTDGVGISFAESVVIENNYNKVSSSNAYNNADVLLNETFLNEFRKNTLGYYREVAEKRLLNGQDSFRNIVSETIKETKISLSKFNAAVDVRKIENALYNTIYSKFHLFDVTNEQRSKLFFGNTSVASTTRIAQEKFKNNYFVQSLIIKADKGKPSFVGVNSKAKDPKEIDLLIEGFEDLFDGEDFLMIDGKAYTSRDYAIDIIRQSFFSSGFSSSLNSIHNLIPTSFMIESGFDDFIKDRFSNLDVDYDRFVKDFMLNNYDDFAVVPKVRSSNKDAGVTYLNGTDINEGISFAKIDVPMTDEKEPSKVVTIEKVLYDNFGDRKVTLWPFELVGEKDGKFIYKPANKKGYYDKGYRIKEYNTDGDTSIILKNNSSIGLGVKAKEKTEAENNELFNKIKEQQKGNKSVEKKEMILQFTDRGRNSSIEKLFDSYGVESFGNMDLNAITEEDKAEALPILNGISKKLKINNKQDDFIDKVRTRDYITVKQSDSLFMTGDISFSNKKMIISDFGNVSMELAKELGKPFYFYSQSGNIGWYVLNKEGNLVITDELIRINSPRPAIISNRSGGLKSEDIKVFNTLLNTTFGGGDVVVSTELRREIDPKYKELEGKLSKYTGIAGGSDSYNFWDLEGEKRGFTNFDHYVSGFNRENNKVVGELSSVEMKTKNVLPLEVDKVSHQEGIVEITKVAKELGILNEKFNIKSPEIIKIYKQVSEADAVFSISNFIEKGEKIGKDERVATKKQAKGNSAYAVQLAINQGKPVYVFDQSKGQWFYFNNNEWNESNTPVLTEKFGTFADNLNKKGQQAILDVYEATIEKERANDNTVTSVNSGKNDAPKFEKKTVVQGTNQKENEVTSDNAKGGEPSDGPSGEHTDDSLQSIDTGNEERALNEPTIEGNIYTFEDLHGARFEVKSGLNKSLKIISLITKNGTKIKLKTNNLDNLKNLLNRVDDNKLISLLNIDC